MKTRYQNFPIVDGYWIIPKVENRTLVGHTTTMNGQNQLRR